MLLQAGLTLASELALPTILRKIVELACGIARARAGTLVILGPRGEVQDVIAHGLEEPDREIVGPVPSPEGMLGRLLEERRPVRVERMVEPASFGFPEGGEAASFLGVPVLVRGQVFGALGLVGGGEAAGFVAEDEQAVVTLAAQAGVAIQNAHLYWEGRLREWELEAINEVARAILEGREADEVLRLVARRARELIGSDLATVATPDVGGELLVQRVADGVHAEELLGMTFPIEGSISGDAMRARRPLMIQDASSDPRVHEPMVRLGGIGPAMFVPLAVRKRAFGTIALANLQGRRSFSDQDLRLVQTFAAEAAVALEYAEIGRELERLAVMEDRERIARELHDGVIQSLFAVGMSLQATLAGAGDADLVQTRLGRAVDEIDRVIKDLRTYIFALRPGSLAGWELESALRSLARSFEAGGMSVRVEVDQQAASVMATRARDLVQVTREAVSNAVRHSGGSTVLLSLSMGAGEAVLRVSDDGRGFAPEGASRGGHGFPNIRSRVDALGGTLTVDSGPGRGTAITVSIPVTRTAEGLKGAGAWTGSRSGS